MVKEGDNLTAQNAISTKLPPMNFSSLSFVNTQTGGAVGLGCQQVRAEMFPTRFDKPWIARVGLEVAR